MRIGPSLILAGRQTLAMTPQLQQAIKLLQFSHLELAAFIQQELEKNPLLQEGSSDDGPATEPEATISEAPADTAEALAAAAPALADADDRWSREFADRGGDASAASAKGGQRDDVPDALDFVSERPQSLAAYVLEQIELLFADPADRRIALKLAEGLDEAGYCRLEASAVADGIHVDVASVERVWAKLRQIEPAGLFARTVSECLAAQLAERDRLDPAMKALLDNLDLVAAGELGQLRRRCGVDDEDLHDMLAELRTLDPRPGQKFDYEPIQPVAPDLSACIVNQASAWVFPKPKGGPVFFEVPPEWRTQFNDWYEREHVPMLLECPQWLMCRRFELQALAGCPWTHMALHYLSDLRALSSPQRDAARSTPWRRELEQHDWFRYTHRLGLRLA